MKTRDYRSQFFNRKLVLAFLIFLWGPIYAWAQISTGEVKKGIISVKLTEQTVNQISLSQQNGVMVTGIQSLDAMNQQFGVTNMKRIFRPAGKFEERHRRYGLHLWYRIEVPENVDLNSMVQSYGTSSQVQIAEKVYEKRLTGQRDPEAQLNFTPDDTEYDDQWHYHNTGQTGGTVDADIDLPEAWDIQTGSSDVIVQIIDSGADLDHPDLETQIWVNPGEDLNGNGVIDASEENGVDDDSNGFIDDFYGYDHGDDDNDPSPAGGHGTHTAGTIGAATNNGTGVAGVAGGDGTAGSGVRLMISQTFSNANTGGFAEALTYGADNGAVISSNSWGYTSSGVFEQAVLDAIDYFNDNAGSDPSAPMSGGLVVFAAGNDNSSADWYPGYYATTIAVASSDFDDVRSGFSNYGEWVDITGPGGDGLPYEVGPDIVSTLPDGYGPLSGTSMSCPHVSGVLGLIVSENAGSITNTQARNILESTADDIDPLNPGFEGMLGTGRVNAANAVGAAPDNTPPAAITDLSAALPSAAGPNVEQGTSVELTWTATGDDGTTGTAVAYDIRYSTTGPIDDSNFDAATEVENDLTPQSAGATETYTVEGVDFGTEIWFAIKVIDDARNSSNASNSPSVTTGDPPVADVNPTSLSTSLLVDESDTQTITVMNTGTSSNLDFGFRGLAAEEMIEQAAEMNDVSRIHESHDHEKSNDTYSGSGHPIVLGAGGPDDYGYYWIDSEEEGGPTFEWTDITTDGTEVTLGDDDAVTVSLPWDFPFYGLPKQNVQISSNGYLGFGSDGSDFSNDEIPSTTQPNDYIAPFWDDLSPDDGGTVHHYYDETNNRFIVQYTEVPEYPGDPEDGVYTFQVILYPTGAIKYQYLDVEGGGDLQSATVGIENASGDDGLQVAYNTDYIQDSLAVFVEAVPEYLSASPTSGSISAGGSMNVDITFDATGVDVGTYDFDLKMETNDPNQTLIPIETSMEVSGEPFPFTLSPESISEVLESGEQTTVPLTITNNDSEEAQTFSMEVFGAAGLAPNLVPNLNGEMSKEDYLEMMEERAAEGKYPKGSASPSFEAAPGSNQNGLGSGADLTALTGYPAHSTNLFDDTFVEFDLGEPSILNDFGSSPSIYAGDFAYGQTDRFFVITNDDNNLHSINTSDGSITTLGELVPANAGESWTELATDPTDGTMYASTSDGNSSYLYTIDTENAEANLVGTIDGTSIGSIIIAIAIDQNGKMFGHDISNDQLITIADSTGAATVIGPTGFDANFAQGMDFDLATGRLYMAAYNNANSTGELRTVNKNTGLTTLVGTLGSGDELGYLALGSTGFVDINLLGATLPPGGSFSADVTLDATGLYEGTYNAAIRVVADVAADPYEEVPVELQVNADPEISVEPLSLDFGQVFENKTVQKTVRVSNTGLADLDISTVEFSNDDYSLGPGLQDTVDATLFPGEFRDFLVQFTPTSVGEINGTMSINSNDPDEGTVAVDLAGEGIPAPAITVNPESFDLQAYPGLDYDRTLTVENTGGNPLGFSITEDVVSQPEPSAVYRKAIYSENFDDGIPSDWAVTDSAGSGIVWTLNSDLGEGNYTGSGEAATALSFGSSDPFDTELRSSTITATRDNHTLRFKVNYQNFAQFDTLDVDISTDGGSTWTNLISWSEDIGALFEGPGETITANISSHVSSGDEFMIRWHYYDSAPFASGGDWYAQIDDVEILAPFEWLTIDVTADTLEPDEARDINLSFNAEGLDPGTYEVDLNFETNDPLNPQLTVPVNLEVIENVSVNADVQDLRYFDSDSNFVPLQEINPNREFFVPIKVSSLEDLEVFSYEFDLTFDSTFIEPLGVRTDSTLSEGTLVAVNTSNPGELKVAVADQGQNETEDPPTIFVIDGDTDNLIYAKFRAKEKIGADTLSFDNFLFNEGGPPAGAEDSPYEVVPLYGDASLNLEITTYDASLTLQHVVELITLSSAGQVTADVSGNGQVSAQDASLIQRYVVGAIDDFPVNQSQTNEVVASGKQKNSNNASAVIAFGQASADIEKDSVLHVPMSFDHSQGITAAFFRLKYDKEQGSVESIAPNLPKGWVMSSNIDKENGEILFAMAGHKPIQSGKFADLSVKLRNEDSILGISGEVTYNENSPITIEGSEVRNIPTEFALNQNFPNPFNPSTVIRYEIAEQVNVRLDIYDVLGRRVTTLVDAERAPGVYDVRFNASRLASGIYFYRLQAGSKVFTKKLTLIK